MFIELYIKKDLTDKKPIPELCEFKGIRWDNYGFVVIQTNHSRHNYVMPMEKEQYLELEKRVKSAYLKKANLVELSGDIFRVRKDNYTLTKGKKTDWSLNIVG